MANNRNSKFTYGIDCPVCGSSKDDCRREDFPNGRHIVYCRQTDTPLDNSYKLKGSTKDGVFNIFMQGGASHPIVKTEAPKNAPPETTLTPLTREQANTEYRRLAAHSGLSQRHRVDLLKRGLTSGQIDELHRLGWIWTWQSGQRCNPSLPGATPEGKTREFKGYAIGVPDANGLIIGAQIHSDQGNPKYYWASSAKVGGNAPDSITGDNPIGIYPPILQLEQGELDESPKGILLAEGFLKPMIAAQQHGYVGIGAAGGNFAGSATQLNESLNQLFDAGIKRKLVIAPDANCFSPKSPNVLSNVRATISVVKDILTPKLAWWGQGVGKHHGDIDEVSRDRIGLITVEEFEAIASEHEPIGSINQALDQFRQQLYLEHSRTARTFRISPERYSVTADFYYETEQERRTILLNLAESGTKHVLNRSGTGSGKTTGVNQYECEHFDVSQIVYVTNDPNNPPEGTLSLNKWDINPAKHNGRTRNHHGKLRLAKDGDDIALRSNCSRTRTIAALRAKNVEGADSKRICTGCPHFDACGIMSGDGYGARHQKRMAMINEYLISHPKSLPILDGVNRYDDKMLVIDEALRTITGTSQFSFSISDLRQVQQLVYRGDTELYRQLEPIFFELEAQMSRNDIGHYGENMMISIKDYPEAPDKYYQGVRDQLENITKPTIIGSLTEAGDMAIKLKGLDKSTIKAIKSATTSEMHQQDLVDAHRVVEHEVKQWLLPFLDILRGVQRDNLAEGNLHLNKDGSITLTLRDEQILEIIHDASLVEYLDATATKESIAIAYGLSSYQIVSIAKKQPPTDNVTIYQVTDLGLCSRQRGDSNQARISAIVNHKCQLNPDTVIFDYRSREDSYRQMEGVNHTGAWLVDSRGSNDYKDKSDFVPIGVAIPNVSQALATFITLTGEIVEKDDPKFVEYLQRQAQAENHQLIGRARAQLRPNQHVTFTFLTDYDLGLPSIKIKASDITWDAATKEEITLKAMQDAERTLRQKGVKPTQQRIADALKLSQGWISKLFQRLLNTNNSHQNNFTMTIKEAKDCAEILAILGSEPDFMVSMRDAFGFIRNLLRHVSIADVIRALELSPGLVQKRIISALILALPEHDIGEVRQFYLESAAMLA